MAAIRVALINTFAAGFQSLPLDVIHADGRRETLAAILGEQAKNRITVMTEWAITASSIVGVQHDDALLIGEVLSSQREQNTFRTEIRIRHRLNGLQRLMKAKAELWM